jgi:hypothetical protein
VVVIKHVHEAIEVGVTDSGGAEVAQVREDFANVSAPAQFGAAVSADEGVLAKGDELHGEGFVTCAHVEGMQGGVGEP